MFRTWPLAQPPGPGHPGRLGICIGGADMGVQAAGGSADRIRSDRESVRQSVFLAVIFYPGAYLIVERF